ncbi:MAG: NUDIX hydrolase [Polyangiaceae bacterium]
MLTIPRGILGVAKEAARHLLRRPVVGVAAAATSPDGRWLLIQRASGLWALPGGTLEWGESLAEGIRRELEEEAGAETLAIERLVGVYSKPQRDSRFHAVTVVVRVQVNSPTKAPMNPVEIRDARLFAEHELPSMLAHEMTDMLADAIAGKVSFE